uniref:BTB domain-containing protein n=1 Tax=Melanopsichium pennsylvanicum 4 TaxID=1398559 RepID=A0A077R4R5_9BASI|nr:conserved hypothetical protein [Melanopsichium pennsylvanicum 4]
MSASAAAPDDRPSQSSRSFAAVRASGMPASANTDTRMRSESCAPGLISAPLSAAGPSRTSTTSPPRRLQQHDPVRAAQEQATRVWRADMRRLLEQAEQRFADVCWTTATPDSQDQANLDSDLGHVTFAASSTGHIGSHEEHASPIPTPQPQPQPQSHEFTTTIPSHSASASSATFIWAHKAILYARAPNTFQTRFLNLRSPAAQLQHIGSTASLITLPLQDGGSHLSLASILSSSTQTGVQLPDTVGTSSNANSLSGRPSVSAKPRKSIRGTAPPSSFSMNKSSLRKPISRSSISRPLRRGSIDDAASVGFTTSDSEGEGGPASSHAALRLIHARQSPSVDPASLTSPSMLSQTSSSSARRIVPARKRSFASVASTVESHLTDNCSVISNASTLRAPISLAGVSKAYFEATLQYFYTGEEAMIDAFEFLFEDKLASDSEVSPEEKLDKLRSDLTFMWRGKLYSDVKIVLGDDDSDGTSDGGQRKRGLNKMLDIPDANMSVLSLAQTVDTDRVDSESEGDELTSFSSHRMILASRSQYFSSLLLSPYADSTAPVLHLPSPPFTPASLHFTLGFLYTGTLFFSNRTFDLSTAFALWRAGSYLQIETLQSLVVALIDREFCHGFHCSPQPCRKCLKRVPRTLAFASSPDVSESALLEPALGAVSGESFGMYWGKDIGQLDVMLQDRIVDSVSTRLQTDPTQVVAVLRQLSIVGQKIDTERSSRWVESLRLMAETVENRLLPVLNANLDKIVQSKPWSDLLDGVGSLGDVLEKCLVMLIDRLTESKAAKVYQTLVGQVLLREQGFEMAASRSAVENARASILRYLKKRWINVRALRGFNGLDKWCLQELADELEMSTQDLILSDEAPAKVTTPPSRLLAGRRSSPLASTGTLPTARGTTARSSLGNAAGTRLRTTSSASTVPTAASPVRPPLVHDGERVAGPNRMRAAVLNRNAARNSVTNGHRSLSSASSTSLSSPTSRPASSSGGRMTASSTPNARTAVTASTRASGSDVSSSRSAALNKDRISGKQSHRTASGGSVASVRSVNGSASAAANASPRPASSAIFSTSASAAQRFPTSTANNTGPGTEKGITPKRSTSALPIPRSPDTDKTPTKTIRPIRSTSTLSPRTPCAAALKSDPSVDHKTASSLEITSTALAPPTKDIDRNLSNNDFDFVTDGVGDGKARTTGAFTVDSELAKVDAGVAEAKQSPCSSSCSADTAMKKWPWCA